MRENKIKLREGIYLAPFICGFFYFMYIFIKVPVIDDRWMESWAYYDLQDTWRVLFTQIRWMQGANARVFSNLFSVLFDKNVYVRGMLNAFMLMAFCYLSTFGFRKCLEMDGRKKAFLSLLSVALIAFVSWNIKIEVYLYATTLYLSSVLVVLVNIMLLYKCFYRGHGEKKEFVVLYMFQLGTLLWLENVSLVLAGICTLNVFILYLTEHKINKRALASMIISIIGLLIMYIDIKIAAPGRFGGGAAKNFDYSHITEFIYDNIYIILVLILLTNYFFHEIFKKEKKRVLVLAYIFLDVLSVAAILLVLKSIYEIISADLWVEIPYAWAPFKWQIVDDFFYKINRLFEIMLIPSAVLFLVFLVVILYKLNRIYDGGAMLVAVLLSFAFQCMYYGGAGRIESLTIFGIISLILLLAGNMELKAKSPINRFIFRMVSVCIFACALIQFDSLHMFVHSQAEIGEERQHIAELVHEEQLLGRWDYSETVVMPAFSETIDGRCLLGPPNPEKGNPYYDYGIIQRYYDLDPQTKIIFE